MNTVTQPTGSIRDGFGKALAELGSLKSEVVVLSADLTESVRAHWFKEKFPKRFVKVGVAEQNLVGISAGLALAGKIPFACSYATFSPGRSWDQIRVSVCYSNANVKLIGGHAGITVGPDGASHQALEDIAITRVLPNMTVVVPADEHQAFAATKAIAQHDGPCYLRLSRIKSDLVTSSKTPFELGKAQILRTGHDVTIIATGIMVAKAMETARALTRHHISAEVINMHTIKPLDTNTIMQSVRKTNAVVTAEEHQITGGLGSAVSEFLSENHPVPIVKVGVRDTFGESGEADELMRKYGLEVTDIAQAVKKAMRMSEYF